MAEFDDWGASEILLSESSLAQIGRAAIYESQAKSHLTSSLKALQNKNFEEWLKLEKWQFLDIVKEIWGAVEKQPKIKPYFEPIKRNHERWRDSRNMIVHVVWGQNELGQAHGHCYRRNKSCDENDIVQAMNDCFWLSKKCRIFQYQVALLIAEGVLQTCPDGIERLKMKVSNQWVSF